MLCFNHEFHYHLHQLRLSFFKVIYNQKLSALFYRAGNCVSYCDDVLMLLVMSDQQFHHQQHQHIITI
jgi:hypothetical protein